MPSNARFLKFNFIYLFKCNGDGFIKHIWFGEKVRPHLKYNTIKNLLNCISKIMICHQLQDFCWKDQFFRFFNIIKSKPFSQVILKKEVGNHKTSSFKERKHEMVLSVKKLFNKKLFCHFLSNYRSLRVLFVGKVKALKSVFKYIFIIFYVSLICQRTWEEGILSAVPSI